MGQIHLEVTLKRAEALGVGIDTDMPKVPYRETITGNAESSYTHKKQTGGAGQYGRVDLKIEPTPEGFEFESSVFGGAISQQFVALDREGHPRGAARWRNRRLPGRAGEGQCL